MLKLLLVWAVVVNMSRNIDTCQVCDRFVPRMFRLPETHGDPGRMKKAFSNWGLTDNVIMKRNRNMNRMLENQLEGQRNEKRGKSVKAKDNRIRITKIYDRYILTTY